MHSLLDWSRKQIHTWFEMQLKFNIWDVNQPSQVDQILGIYFCPLLPTGQIRDIARGDAYMKKR